MRRAGLSSKARSTNEHGLAVLGAAVWLGWHGLFVYGRKQHATLPLVCGIALMVVPYAIANTWLLVAAGIALMAIPYYFR